MGSGKKKLWIEKEVRLRFELVFNILKKIEWFVKKELLTNISPRPNYDGIGREHELTGEQKDDKRK